MLTGLGYERVITMASPQPEDQVELSQFDSLQRPKTGLVAEWNGYDELSRRRGEQKRFMLELATRTNYAHAMGVWNHLLCLSVFPRAAFRRGQASIKMRTVLDHDGYSPAFVGLAGAKFTTAASKRFCGYPKPPSWSSTVAATTTIGLMN